MIAILAGNRHEFKRWAEDHTSDNDYQSGKYLYIESEHPKYYAGLIFEAYEVVGTFWERQDSSHIYSQILSRVWSL